MDRIRHYSGYEVQPVIPDDGISLPVQLGRNLTLAAGQILGQVGSAINHTFTITKTGSVTGGTFALGSLVNPAANGSEGLGEIAYNVSNQELQDALEAVFGAGNVRVSGTALPTGPLTIELIGTLAGIPTSTPTINSTGVAGGGSLAITESAVGQTAGTFVPVSTLRVANPTAAPNVTVVTDGAGTIAAGAHAFAITYLTGSGETAPSPAKPLTLAATNSVRLPALAGLSSAVTAVKLYINGRFLGQVPATGGTSPQSDFSGATATGASAPSYNATANAKCVLPNSGVTDFRGKFSLGGQLPSGYIGDGGQLPSMGAFFQGLFDTKLLVGLDADVAAQLGRLYQGTIADGLLCIR